MTMERGGPKKTTSTTTTAFWYEYLCRQRNVQRVMVVPSLMMTACAVGFFLLLFLPFVMVPTALAGGVGWGL